MKKKRRIATLIVNILAASCAIASVWLPWFDGGDAMKTTVTFFFGIFNFMPTTAFTFTVAAVIFLTAALMIVAAITALKVFDILSAIFGFLVVGLWAFNSGFSGDFNINRIGFGAILMTTAVILSIISLFIFRKREKS
ncbi:hypothetical protein FWF74_00845 [Candidatus Saccharibacteria bacterium]|nr:hypothetical protein [Candidatus Saccharibacteria bacterium]MCL1963278.1 hypothetical protein [Candidatus Saccharibacteria bacterium]